MLNQQGPSMNKLVQKGKKKWNRLNYFFFCKYSSPRWPILLVKNLEDQDFYGILIKLIHIYSFLLIDFTHYNTNNDFC